MTKTGQKTFSQIAADTPQGETEMSDRVTAVRYYKNLDCRIECVLIILLKYLYAGTTDMQITTVDETPEKDRRFVTALARGLDILTCFCSDKSYLGNGQISHRTGLAKPTVSRLTYTLTQLGYLTFSKQYGKYTLGPSFIKLGYSQLARMKARRIARPLMQALAEYSQGSVNFAIREGLSMVYIDTYRTASTYKLQLEVGSQIPLATTAMGRAYFCTLSENKREPFLSRIKNNNPVKWPVIKAGLETALHKFHDRGFCLSLGDWRTETHSVAVPLPVDIAGSEATVFSCGGPSFLFTREKLESDLGPRLLNLVSNVKTALQTQNHQ